MNRRSLLHGVLASLIAPRALGHPGGTKENESIGPFGTPLPATEIPATDRCPGVTRHVNTGFEELDSLLGELRDGRLVAISGRPSMGKTSLALAIAAHVTARVRLPVAIFGAPLSDQEIRALMIGFLARVDPWQAKLLLAGATARSATHAAQILASAPLLIDDRPFLNMEDLRSKIVWNSAQAGLRNGLTVVLA